MKHRAATLSVLVLAAISVTLPAGAEEASTKETQKSTTNTTEKKETEKKETTQPQTPAPKIDSVVSQALPLGVPQKLTISGSDLADGATVKLTAPSGSQTTLDASQVKRVSATQVEVSATFGEEGEWQVAVQNPGGATAATSKIKVAAIAPDRSSVEAYKGASGAVGVLIFLAAIVIVVSLGIASYQGKWSLGDALSEEAALPPGSAAQDVKMVASSSRLIALVGLVGILTIVVGVGWAVMWRLFVYGAAPDLAKVQNFLFGSACLFAPYLANQLRGIFGDRADAAAAAAVAVGDGSATKPDDGAASITSLVLSDEVAGAAAKTVRVTGAGFQKGVAVTLTDPHGTDQTITGANVTFSSPALIAVSAVLNRVGGWKVSVKNPKADASSPFLFTVQGPPVIGGVNPLQPAHGAMSTLTFFGEGFIPTPTMEFTLPAAGGVAAQQVAGNVTKLDENRLTVEVNFPQAGAWQAVATNPGNRASAAFNITVT